MFGKIRRILAIVPLEVHTGTSSWSHTFRHTSVRQPEPGFKVSCVMENGGRRAFYAVLPEFAGWWVEGKAGR